MLFSQYSGINVTEPDLKIDAIATLPPNTSTRTDTITPSSNQYVMIWACTSAASRLKFVSNGTVLDGTPFVFGGTLSFGAATKHNPLLFKKGSPVTVTQQYSYVSYAILSETN